MQKNKEQPTWVASYVREYAWLFLLIIMLSFLSAGCAAAMMYTAGALISKAALRPENILMIYVPIVLVRTFGFGKGVIQYAERLLSHSTILKVLGQMRVRMYQTIEPHVLTVRRSISTGRVLGLLAEDIEGLQNLYLRALLPVCSSVLLFGIGITALGMYDVKFALWLGCFVGILAFIIPCIALFSTIRRRQEWKERRSRTYQELTDAVLGLTDWIMSGQSGRFIEEFKQTQLASTCINQYLRRYDWRLNWFVYSLSGLVIICMTLWAGNFAAEGKLDVVWIAAFGLVAFPLMDTLLRTSNAIMELPEYRSSVERIKQMEQDANMVAQEMKYREAADKVASFDSLESAMLELQEVGFRYPGSEEWAVRQVNLQIPQGKKVAILGRSGSGKSTLLQLIQGSILSSEGSIRINENTADGGQNNLFSFLNQSPYLFDTSVANNIRLACPDADDEQIHQVIQMVGLDRLIGGLPQGIHTSMHEAGSRFSGGERQRIALARVLLQDRPIVLLDEPTVGLDPITEKKLIDTILDVLKDRSLVWVTHHLTGLEQMDEIIFMEDGFVKMRGSHHTLMANDRYRNLYELDHFSYSL
ncbi:thiol reductant ABC exporter subunit CydC [Paenibacillus sp. An7]|uniref:thiol reductant ABC exporter subunit CydC n=1 Tax=Paenibacillus sp. An7 TaxID=2689577 RepID=UPI00135A9068|nr:thiol reductant ABC exporter subunit CydC [Paenibacillus sp. An7]